MRRNMTNFRVFGPDETASNKLAGHLRGQQENLDRGVLPRRRRRRRAGSPTAASWRCSASTPWKAWLEGYLLTGRHGFFSTYEAFVHVIDSMFNQHAKWLEISKLELSWRAPISSLNLLITSLRLAAGPQRLHPPGSRLPRCRDQQERRTSRASICRPMRTACSPWPTTACAAPNYVNVIVADKQPHLQYLDMECRHRPLHQGHRHLGLGQHRRRATSRTW